MIEGLVIAAALSAGVDLRVVAILGIALLFPIWALGGVLALVLRNRRRTSTRPAIFCHAVARELRAGATLRAALLSACASAGIELEADGDLVVSLADLTGVLARAIPVISEELVALVTSADESGVASAALFEELGDLAMAHVELEEELRIATAPARASALVLLGLPVAFIGYQVSSGSLPPLFGGGPQSAIALIGAALAASGVTIGFLMVRRVL